MVTTRWLLGLSICATAWHGCSDSEPPFEAVAAAGIDEQTIPDDDNAPAARERNVDRSLLPQFVAQTHESAVLWTRFSPDAQLLVTGHTSDGVWVWDAEAGRRLFRLSIPDQTLGGEFTPDGRQIFVYERTGNLSMWDAVNGAPLWRQNLNSLVAASGNSDEIAQKNANEETLTIVSAAFDAAGQYIAICGAMIDHAQQFGRDYTWRGWVVILEPATGRLLQFDGTAYEIPYTVSFSADSTHLLTTNYHTTFNSNLEIVKRDFWIHLQRTWVQDRKPYETVPSYTVYEHTYVDGRVERRSYLASNVSSGGNQGDRTLPGRETSMLYAALDPTGRRLLVANDLDITDWDLATFTRSSIPHGGMFGRAGDEHFLLEIPPSGIMMGVPEIFFEYTYDFGGLEFSPDGEFFAGATGWQGDRAIKVWEADTGRLIATHALPKIDFDVLQLSPQFFLGDGSLIGYRINDEARPARSWAEVWNWREDKVVTRVLLTRFDRLWSNEVASRELPGAHQRSFGESLATTVFRPHPFVTFQYSIGSYSFKWDVARAELAQIQEWEGNDEWAPRRPPLSSPVESLRLPMGISADEITIRAASDESLVLGYWSSGTADVYEDDRIVAWNGETGEEYFRVEGNGFDAGPRDPNDASTVAYGFDFSLDGQWLATSHYNGAVTLWDARTAERIRSIQDAATELEYQQGARFTPGGKLLLARPQQGGSQVVLDDLSTDTDLPLEGLQGLNSSYPVPFSPDGCVLAIGERLFFDARTGRRISTAEPEAGSSGYIFGRDGSFEDGVFSSDSRRYFDGNSLWDVATGRRVATFVAVYDRLEERVEWMIVTPEGYYSASPEGRRIGAWLVNEHAYPLDLYENRFHRPDIVARILQGQPINIDEQVSTATPPPSVALQKVELHRDHGVFEATAVPGSADDPIEQVRFFVNGRLIDGEALTELQSTEENGTVMRQVRIEFPAGRRSLAVSAQSLSVGGLESSPDIFHHVFAGAETAGRRRLFVLAVGVSDYEGDDSDLEYCDDDARALHDLFSSTASSAYDETITTLLVDQDATSVGIVAALEQLREQCRPSDTLILFFSGHGARDPDGAVYYVPHDDANLLPWQLIAAPLGQTRAGTVLFFSDCCHAGGFGRAPASQQEIADALLRDARVMVFSASRGLELSWEMSELQHGAFTFAVLRGLEGAADLVPDGQITISELQAFVATTVKQLTDDRQHPHIPLMRDFDPDAVLIHVP